MLLKKLALLFLALSATLFGARFGIDNIGRIVRLADPQIAPDGKPSPSSSPEPTTKKTATIRNWCSSMLQPTAREA